MILNIDPAGVAGFTAEDRYWFGKLLQVFDEYDEEHVNTALGKCISARHADLLGMNLKCMEIGRDYQE